MNKKYIRFSLIFGGLCLVLLSDAGAVPSVKRLGGANAYIGTSGAVSAKSGNYDKKTNNDARSASIRTNRISGRTGTTTNRPATKANTARLSVGKYLHQSGIDKNIIKKIHPRLPHFKCIGWDFTIDENEKVILIEFNVSSGIGMQYLTGKPAFGKLTPRILQDYFKEKNT